MTDRNSELSDGSPIPEVKALTTVVRTLVRMTHRPNFKPLRGKKGALPSLPHKQTTRIPHASAFGLQHRPESACGFGPARRVGDPPLRFFAPGPRRTGRGRARPAPAFHSEGKNRVRPLSNELVRR